MQKLAFLGLSVVLLLPACMDRTVTGDGHVVTESRSVGGFSAVSISGQLRAEVSEGPASVQLELDDNIIDLVDTHLEGDVLVIRPNQDGLALVPSAQARIVITTPHLDGLDASGATTIDAHATGDAVTIQASGASHVSLAGSAPHVSMDVSGTARVDCPSDTTDATIDVSGDSKVDARASSWVSVAASGDSQVIVRGSPPSRRVDTSGTATVVFDAD